MFKQFFSRSANTDSDSSLAVAITNGTLIPMNQIPDPVFAQGILGNCIGIDPDDGFIYAPTDGIISNIADSLHAIGLTCDNGLELLIHLGIDTVKLNGSTFQCFTKTGKHVKRGQKLMRMDLMQIRDAGYSPLAITCILNASDFPDAHFTEKTHTRTGDPMILKSDI